MRFIDVILVCLRYADQHVAKTEAVVRMARCLGEERLQSKLKAAGQNRVGKALTKALQLAISLLRSPPASPSSCRTSGLVWKWRIWMRRATHRE